MPPDVPDLRPEDIQVCSTILSAGSKSFALASRILPRRVRDPAAVLYAFCRVADDAVDSDPSASATAVDALRARLDRVYAGAPRPEPVERALSAVVLGSRIPRPLLDALVEGFAWDANGRVYETLEDVYAYAARVAGTVGAMMTLLMGPRALAVLARACDLGVAMQLTNIARDVGEDAARGRLYLPAAWMKREGLDPDAWLRHPAPSDALARVVERLLRHADVLYTRADHGIAALPRDCRVAIRAARLIYSDIGTYVARARFDSVSRRARVPGWRKLWLLARAFADARALKSPALAAPPLDATRELIAACGEPS